MAKPVAVLTSDVHFSISTLQLAYDSLTFALAQAERLGVPLIVAGDLNDTKAIIRGEVANVLIDVLGAARTVDVYALVGNHDLINEKGRIHSLNFLRPYVNIVDTPTEITLGGASNVWLIPYHSDVDALRATLSGIKRGALLIMHQGFHGASMGEYMVDKTSLDPSEVEGFRVITGHYHMRQDIGTISYIGTPYSITFAEANDPEKGIRVLDDMSNLDFIPTKLRRHVIVERTHKTVMDFIPGLSPVDKLWLKVSGPASELDKLNKRAIGEKHLGHSDFKFDKLYDEATVTADQIEKLTDEQMLDRLIDESEETKPRKAVLRKLWREIIG